MARKFNVLMLVLVSILSGCAVGWTANKQPLPIPTVAAARSPGQNPCGLDYEHGGSSSFHGVDFFGSMPVYGQGYADVMAGAGRWVRECSVGQAVLLTAEASREAVMHPYGTNPYWQAQTVQPVAATEDNRKVKIEALKYYLETAARLRKGEQPAAASETTVAGSTVTATPNFTGSLTETKNYGELISALESEAAANPDRSALCRTFAKRLRIESAKTSNDFEHDKLEVLKAF